MEIEKVVTENDIKETEQLAQEIWKQHFITIISMEQIEYMLDKFQSKEAITDQIENQNYEYYYFSEKGKKIGYMGFCEMEDKTLFLSKIYILKKYRGKGYARQGFEFLKKVGRGRGLTKIWLTVNKNNSITINIYKNLGMYIERELQTDIDDGYIMDDYVFAYDL